jgi:DNA primase
MRAFEEDQRFVATSWRSPDGCIRATCGWPGDEAVRELITRRQPMFEFAIRTSLRGFDLDTAEGRMQASRVTIPIVARIRELSLRDDYARQLSGWLGLPAGEVLRRVRSAGSGRTSTGMGTGGSGGGRQGRAG